MTDALSEKGDPDKSRLLAIAETALNSWDLEPVSIELFARSENMVFKIKSRPGDRFALRIHRYGYHTLRELESEQTWTRALNEADIHTPEPLPTRDGRGYASVKDPSSHRTLHAGITNWIDGTPLRQLLAATTGNGKRAGYYQQLGVIAARIHNQASNWKPPAGFKRHAFDAEGFMGTSPFWGRFWDLPALKGTERKLILNARDSIYRLLADSEKNPQTYSLIHADLHPGNILVHGDDLYVIDFDDAGFGWHAYELAVALYYKDRESAPELIREAILRGYRSERPLDASTLQSIPLFMLIRTLALAGWLSERPELNRSEELAGMISSACNQIEKLGIGN